MRFSFLKWLKNRPLRRVPARERRLRLSLEVLEDRVVPTVTLTNPDGNANDSFGFSVAAVGSDSIVGAYGVSGTHVETGAAYLYDASGTLLHTFTDPEWFARRLLRLFRAFGGERRRRVSGAPMESVAIQARGLPLQPPPRPRTTCF